jgi:hypothetical protein
VNEFILTRHAFERYCQRVERLERDELVELLRQHADRPTHKKRGYIELAGVWWRYGIRDSVLILYTCYGRHHMDLPAAIRWAKRNRDRINLGGGEAR